MYCLYYLVLLLLVVNVVVVYFIIMTIIGVWQNFRHAFFKQCDARRTGVCGGTEPA